MNKLDELIGRLGLKAMMADRSGYPIESEAIEGVVEFLIEHTKGYVLVPVDDLKVMIKKDSGVMDTEAKTLAMGEKALVAHIQSMIATQGSSENE